MARHILRQQAWYNRRMNTLPGDERYLITDQKAGILHKVDAKGVPDTDGTQFHIVDELDTGYTVYPMSPGVMGDESDHSQPLSLFFIHFQFVTNHQEKQ